MRKYFPIHDEVVSHIRLCNCVILNFLIYEENLIFLFISVGSTNTTQSLLLSGGRCNPKPGRVACLNAGGVKTDDGPGAAMGCFATCRAEITTAWDPWYLVIYVTFYSMEERRKKRPCFCLGRWNWLQPHTPWQPTQPKMLPRLPLSWYFFSLCDM
jgi:hypothetical protein